MTAALVIAGVVIALVVLARRLDPIGGPHTVSDGRDAANVPIRGGSRATPLPHRKGVTTRLRAWVSRHDTSRHPAPPCDCDRESQERVVVEVATGVHVDRPSLDEWVAAALRAGGDRAAVAVSASRQHGVSLRTAQRAVARVQGGAR